MRFIGRLISRETINGLLLEISANPLQHLNSAHFTSAALASRAQAGQAFEPDAIYERFWLTFEAFMNRRRWFEAELFGLEPFAIYRSRIAVRLESLTYIKTYRRRARDRSRSRSTVPCPRAFSGPGQCHRHTGRSPRAPTGDTRADTYNAR